MRRRFFELTFTPAVKAVQRRLGSRESYARAVEPGAGSADAGLGPREVAFLGARDSFYLASVSETGWPYIQHRGGPAGFVRVLDDRTIGWREFRGNRQYITTGNVSSNDRVALFFVDYAARRRLKLLGRMQVSEAASRPELVGVPDSRAGPVEAWALVRVEAFDWNCPQYITPRFTAAECAAAAEGAGRKPTHTAADAAISRPAPTAEPAQRRTDAKAHRLPQTPPSLLRTTTWGSICHSQGSADVPA